MVFARQIEALGRPDDVASALAPAAARSPWPAACARRASAVPARGPSTGAAGGRVGAAAEHGLRVPSADTARIQEMHITIIHGISELVDRHVAEQE